MTLSVPLYLYGYRMNPIDTKGKKNSLVLTLAPISVVVEVHLVGGQASE